MKRTTTPSPPTKSRRGGALSSTLAVIGLLAGCAGGNDPVVGMDSADDDPVGGTAGEPIDPPGQSETSGDGGGSGDDTPPNPVDDTGADDTGAEDTGGEDTGAEDTGGEDTGAEDTGGEDTGAEDTGGEDTGAEDTGGEETGGEETGDPPAPAPSLNQAAYVPGTTEYEFGFNSIPTIPITGAPADTDFTRSAMLHDGDTYRLYFMPEGEDDAVYQFGFDAAAGAYDYGFNSIPTIPVTGAPDAADTSSFAMLHDGDTYRLYFLSEDAPLRVYQFGFDPAEGEYIYGYNSIPQINIVGTPAGADWDGWGMLHDGDTYRLYAFGSAAHDTIVQHGFDGANYTWGSNSIPTLDLTMIPADSNTDDFAMLHDGADYRFYMLTQ